MTSTSMHQRVPTSATASRSAVLAAVGLAAAAAVSAVAADDPLTEFAMAAIVAGLAFGLWVAPAANGHPGRRSGILAALAVVGLLVASTGIPFVLAAASVACALKQRDVRGSYDYGAELGLLVSALTTAVAILLVALG